MKFAIPVRMIHALFLEFDDFGTDFEGFGVLPVPTAAKKTALVFEGSQATLRPLLDLLIVRMHEDRERDAPEFRKNWQWVVRHCEDAIRDYVARRNDDLGFAIEWNSRIERETIARATVQKKARREAEKHRPKSLQELLSIRIR